MGDFDENGMPLGEPKTQQEIQDEKDAKEIEEGEKKLEEKWKQRYEDCEKRNDKDCLEEQLDSLDKAVDQMDKAAVKTSPTIKEALMKAADHAVQTEKKVAPDHKPKEGARILRHWE